MRRFQYFPLVKIRAYSWTNRKRWGILSVILLTLAVCLLSSADPAQAVSSASDLALLPADATSGPTFAPQGQAEPVPPNPLIYLDIWLFGGLVLLVALFVGIKYIWKAFQPDDRDPSEGLQPWERPDNDEEW